MHVNLSTLGIGARQGGSVVNSGALPLLIHNSIPSPCLSKKVGLMGKVSMNHVASAVVEVRLRSFSCGGSSSETL